MMLSNHLFKFNPISLFLILNSNCFQYNFGDFEQMILSVDSWLALIYKKN